MHRDEHLHLTAMAVVLAVVAAMTPFGALFAPVIVGGFVRRYAVMLLAIGAIAAWMTLRGTYEGPSHGASITALDFFLDRALYIVPWYLGLAHLAYAAQRLVRHAATGRGPDLDARDDPREPEAPMKASAITPAETLVAPGSPRAGRPGTADGTGSASPGIAAPLHVPTWKRGTPILAPEPGSAAQNPARKASTAAPGQVTPATPRPAGRRSTVIRTLAGVTLVVTLGGAATVGTLGALGLLPPLGAPWPWLDTPGPTTTARTGAADPSFAITPQKRCESPDDHPFLVPENAPYHLMTSTIDGVPFLWITDRFGAVWWMEDFVTGDQGEARISGPGGHNCGLFTNGYLSYGTSVYSFDGKRFVNRRVVCVVESDTIACEPNPAW